MINTIVSNTVIYLENKTVIRFLGRINNCLIVPFWNSSVIIREAIVMPKIVANKVIKLISELAKSKYDPLNSVPSPHFSIAKTPKISNTAITPIKIYIPFFACNFKNSF